MIGVRAGAGGGLLSHQRVGEKQDQVGEDEKKGYTDEQRNQEWVCPGIDDAHGDLRYVLYDKYRHRDRGYHGSDAYRHGYYDARPYRIIAELDDCGKKYRRREYHECDVIDEGTAEKIDEKYETHDNVTVQWEAYDPLRHVVRNIRDRYEMAPIQGMMQRGEGPCWRF